MPRIRTVKPEWLDDEKLSAAGSDARVMSIALILMADDYGNGRANDMVVAGHVFALDRDPVKKSREALATLEKVGFARRYVVRGQTYYHIQNWHRHQRVDNPSKPIYPMPHEADNTNDGGGLGIIAWFCPNPRENLVSIMRVYSEMLASDLDLDLDPDPDQLRLLPGGPKVVHGVRVAKDLKRNPTKTEAELWNFWRKVHHKAKTHVMDNKRLGKISRALDNHTLTEMKKVIIGCKNSKFHMGENEHGDKHNDIELICRNEKNFTNFIRLYRPGEERDYGENFTDSDA